MKIEKMILFSLLYSMLTVANGQSWISNGSIDFKDIIPEIEWFIKKAKTNSYEVGKHNVYLVKITGKSSLEYCATMEYIQDSLWVSEIGEFKHYLELNGELITSSIALPCIYCEYLQWRWNPPISRNSLDRQKDLSRNGIPVHAIRLRLLF
jgi:hypothetical protein